MATREKEAYSTHCRYCFQQFESESILAAVKKAQEHEATCPDAPPRAA